MSEPSVPPEPKQTDLDELDPETREFVLAGIERLRRRIAANDFSTDPSIGEKQSGYPGAIVTDGPADDAAD